MAADLVPRLAVVRRARCAVSLIPAPLLLTLPAIRQPYPLAGIQHIEYYNGDADENLKPILRSLERIGVTISVPRLEPAPGVDARAAMAVPLAGQAGEPKVESGALAVLPFDNISPDRETDYFSDGLTEELIARLSVFNEIELVSRWASMQFKGAKQDPKTIGRELGARYIVGGSESRSNSSTSRPTGRSGEIHTRASSTTPWWKASNVAGSHFSQRIFV